MSLLLAVGGLLLGLAGLCHTWEWPLEAVHDFFVLSCLLACLFDCLFMFVCLFVCLFVGLFVGLFVCLFV